MIIASQLYKTFAARDRTITAVENVSFEVAAGEVYGLLGPNGAGKTTTLRMVWACLPLIQDM